MQPVSRHRLHRMSSDHSHISQTRSPGDLKIHWYVNSCFGPSIHQRIAYLGRVGPLPARGRICPLYMISDPLPEDIDFDSRIYSPPMIATDFVSDIVYLFLFDKE